MEHGTLDTPIDYLCEVAHVQARYLGLVEEGEKAWAVEDWRVRIDRMEMRGIDKRDEWMKGWLVG